MRKILLIDSNAICHSVSFALPKLTYEGLSTAIIYGFLVQLLNLQKIHQGTDVVFAWDSTESKREALFPAYKAKRKAKRKLEREAMTPEELKEHACIYGQFSLLQENILPALGFSNVFSQVGHEGDDIIASVCKSYPNAKIVIVSGDGDLFQLINSQHSMWYLKDRKMLYESDISERYQIHPSRFAEMKSLCGCTSDEVPGIAGVGETKAIQYMCGDLKKTSKIYQRIISSQDVIDFTRKLVELPFEGTEQFKLQPDTCTINKFKRVIRTYGLKSLAEPGYIVDLDRSFCGKTFI